MGQPKSNAFADKVGWQQHKKKTNERGTNVDGSSSLLV